MFLLLRIESPAQRLSDMRPRRALQALLLPLCLLLLIPIAARADERPDLPDVVRLEYDRGAAKSCPAEEVLVDAVIATARRDPFTSDASARLRVTISRRGPRYTALIELRDGAGVVLWRRPFEPLALCMSVVQSVGFIIGDRFRAPPPAPPASPREPLKLEPLPPPAPAPPKVEPPPLPPGDPLRLNLGIAGALALQTASSLVAFNLAADAGLRWRSFSGALEFRWSPPEVASADAAERARIRVEQFSGALIPCGHSRALFGLFYCGVGQVTAVRGLGGADVVPQSITGIAAATGARVGIDLPLPMWKRQFGVRLSADMLVTLLDVALHFGDMTQPGAMTVPPAWTTPRLNMALNMGFVTDLRLDK